MNVGLAGTARNEPPRPTVIRVCWRMQGPTKVVTAALYEHRAGRELRVYFEPESADDLFHSQVERFDFAVLEQKADELHAILRDQGKWPLTDLAHPIG